MGVGVLNIKTHPNSPERYVELFRTARQKQIAHPYWGNKFGMITSFSAKPSPDGFLHHGDIISFTDFDREKPWFNALTQAQASDEEMRTVKTLPKHLKPEGEWTPFVFVPSKHRVLFPFRAKNLVQTTLSKVLNDPRVRGKDIDQVDVILEQSKTALDAIWKMAEIKWLEIVITQPNGDDHAGVQEEMRRRMRAEQAREYRIRAIAHPGRSVEPSETTKALAELGLTDGKVVAHGRVTPTAPVKDRSTEPVARVIPARYDPSKDDVAGALEATARGQYDDSLK